MQALEGLHRVLRWYMAYVCYQYLLDEQMKH